MSIAERLGCADAHGLLASCCCATAWVEGMLARRPFADDEAVMTAANDVAATLGEADWL